MTESCLCSLPPPSDDCAYAMISLALLLTIQQATSSYAVAGFAIGGYALISFLMPLKSRLIDRFGVASVLPGLSLGFTLCVIAIATLALSHIATAWPFLVLAVGTGLFAPPLGPSMRAIWSALTPEPEARRRAYSLDGVVEEVLYAVGPLLVGLILLVAPTPFIAVAAAVLNLTGTLAMVISRASRQHGQPHPAPAASHRWTGPITRPGFGVLLLILFGVGLAGGPLEVSLVARSEEAGRAASIGLLLAALSVGSAVGGLMWGHLVREHHPRRQFTALVAVSAVLGVALVPTTNFIALVGLLFLAGLPQCTDPRHRLHHRRSASGRGTPTRSLDLGQHHGQRRSGPRRRSGWRAHRPRRLRSGPCRRCRPVRLDAGRCTHSRP